MHIAILAAAALAVPAVPGSGWTDDARIIEWTGDACYVDSAEGDRLDVAEYEVYLGPDNAYEWLHVGTTNIGFLPCRPLSCPEPYVLVSTACTLDDPLAHVPAAPLEPAVRTDTPPSSDDPTFTIDVGPLIEPAIVTPWP